jgi:hypothetical protein
MRQHIAPGQGGIMRISMVRRQEQFNRSGGDMQKTVANHPQGMIRSSDNKSELSHGVR